MFDEGLWGEFLHTFARSKVGGISNAQRASKSNCHGKKYGFTVDGKNPAPLDTVSISLFTGFLHVGRCRISEPSTEFLVLLDFTTLALRLDVHLKSECGHPK